MKVNKEWLEPISIKNKIGVCPTLAVTNGNFPLWLEIIVQYANSDLVFRVFKTLLSAGNKSSNKSSMHCLTLGILLWAGTQEKNIPKIIFLILIFQGFI